MNVVNEPVAPGETSGGFHDRWEHFWNIRNANVKVPTPQSMAVKAALSKQGNPYVWGANGPNAFDCSGLTRWAWAQAGVTLGPDTYAQIKQGAPLHLETSRPATSSFPATPPAGTSNSPSHPPRSSMRRSPVMSCASLPCRARSPAPD